MFVCVWMGELNIRKGEEKEKRRKGEEREREKKKKEREEEKRKRRTCCKPA